MTAPLLVPVRLTGGGILHDTDCARGAESVEAAAHIDNAVFNNHGHTRWGADYIMAEVEPFEAGLRAVRVGMKPAYLWLMDESGREWPMFTSDYVTLMSTATVYAGWIERLTYEACKKGASAYGIRLAVGPK